MFMVRQAHHERKFGYENLKMVNLPNGDYLCIEGEDAPREVRGYGFASSGYGVSGTLHGDMRIAVSLTGWWLRLPRLRDFIKNPKQ